MLAVIAAQQCIAYARRKRERELEETQRALVAMIPEDEINWSNWDNEPIPQATPDELRAAAEVRVHEQPGDNNLFRQYAFIKRDLALEGYRRTLMLLPAPPGEWTKRDFGAAACYRSSSYASEPISKLIAAGYVERVYQTDGHHPSRYRTVVPSES